MKSIGPREACVPNKQQSPTYVTHLRHPPTSPTYATHLHEHLRHSLLRECRGRDHTICIRFITILSNTIVNGVALNTSQLLRAHPKPMNVRSVAAYCLNIQHAEEMSLKHHMT